jgi:hypothetical protein
MHVRRLPSNHAFDGANITLLSRNLKVAVNNARGLCQLIFCDRDRDFDDLRDSQQDTGSASESA